jgi:hypothetical protein
MQTELFFTGFFAKVIIDDIFFLMIDKYTIDILSFQITSATRKSLLVVSIILGGVFITIGKEEQTIIQSVANV